VLTCVTIALAGGVVNADSVEGREFVSRVVPKLNRANVVAAVFLLATGLVNLFGAGRRRDFDFSRTFDALMAAKVGLYCLMVTALMASFARERKDGAAGSAQSIAAGAGRMVALSAAAAIAGAFAMALGVWLSGE
jgi:hypothetical protein